MTEAFDASQTDPWTPGLLYLVIPILLGIVLEYARRKLEQRAKRLNQDVWEIVLYALFMQPVFWLTAAPLLFYAITIGIADIPVQIIAQLFGVGATIAVSLLLVRLAIGWLHLTVRRMHLASVSLIDRLFDVLGIVIMLMVVLWTVGFPVQTLLLAVAGSSVGLAFAFQQPLANLFAGLFVAVSNRFSPGQYVKLSNGDTGHVVDIDWFTTTIRQLDNNIISVPNSLMTNLVVTNYQKSGGETSVLVPVGVSYDSDLALVEQVTIEVATEIMREIEGGVPEWQPLIRYTAFADSSITFNVVMRSTAFLNQFMLRHEFIKRLHERYRRENIVIPYPIRTLHMAPGDALNLARATRAPHSAAEAAE